MYPGQKKNAVTRMTQSFLGLSVLILILAIAFGIMVTRDGGAGFKNLISGDSGGLSGGTGNPLSLGK